MTHRILFSNSRNTKLCYDQQKTNKNDLRTYDNIQKIASSQGDDYTTGCLLDYTCFK